LGASCEVREATVLLEQPQGRFLFEFALNFEL